jgi:hypothetical protein
MVVRHRVQKKKNLISAFGQKESVTKSGILFGDTLRKCNISAVRGVECGATQNIMVFVTPRMQEKPQEGLRFAYAH